MMRHRDLILTAAALVAAACGSNRPPEDFAPDPGLLTQIRELRMVTPPRACPGQALSATYSAIMNDGTAIPFATRYDRDHPPASGQFVGSMVARRHGDLRPRRRETLTRGSCTARVPE